jgi:hypothetical protein
MLHVDAFAYRHDGTFTPDMRENAMLLAGDAWVAGFRAALTREPPDGGGEPEPQWRCFHCDKVFTERADRLRNAEFRADHAVGLLDAAGISFDSKPVARAETGPVRVGDDWAGIYLRGDDALALAMAVECVTIRRLFAIAATAKLKRVVEAKRKDLSNIAPGGMVAAAAWNLALDAVLRAWEEDR